MGEPMKTVTFPNDAEIENVLQLCKLATHGRWQTDSMGNIDSEFGDSVIESTDEAQSYEKYGIVNGQADAEYIAAVNPKVVEEYLRCILEAKAVLLEMYADTGDKIDGACPVCGTYTHKGWCWYPRAMRLLGKPLDENDLNFLNAASHG